ncbi:formylglycine-generating enzyme family protein [Mycobacterium sp. CBMA293]|uniref:formylglycine-generating enzyme family protein n=1 Tax=unclassified Mycolicibacterium TaxID=2636767 RepID=UPI001325E64E|nr:MULTISPECIES: formylglycine-generating enzyme family protein [unclassified Mycolicibacterium]MUL48598.1 formylglycine-generating enzyme family protein [Mycolicibacterium sp. CBMA 360]MUL96499.1 formylglycine-generating enzyme family protein [Mycolicibacterium sp. CBMA 230]MUM32215.1 formylglycine-generating enzyme family protein [Mycolicibacterium sp. CBMA 361]MUL62055.1 formylglycine-generating enzyme family protein [Mycolicibacterium sp. CBMA 335]MUL73330.1 formylglycine-generating enzyme
MTLTRLIELPGGEFPMGSGDFYPEERPVRSASVAAFGIEEHPVTSAQFAEFVSETGYLTVAERPMDPELYPGVAEEDLIPGALVFRPTSGPVNLRDWRQWWDWAPGACWRRPFGPGSSWDDRADHPVVQVAYTDALAYAHWAGRKLPSETQWEYAARGGTDTTYAWGDEVAPAGQLMANTWQGRFPYENAGALGWVGTSPVGTFPRNGFGLADMIGNVWEWTTTPFAGPTTEAPTCCPPAEPDPSVTHALKGGSHLCAPEYCHRYRPAARSPQSQDSATTHIGFRCVA